ncbi:MAG: hypothetical protein ACJAY5_000068, partial [Actinomycetes bacterium]
MARKIADPSNDPVLSTYDKYEDAQSAVDKLSDNRFPVQS